MVAHKTGLSWRKPSLQQQLHLLGPTYIPVMKYCIYLLSSACSQPFTFICLVALISKIINVKILQGKLSVQKCLDIKTRAHCCRYAECLCKSVQQLRHTSHQPYHDSQHLISTTARLWCEKVDAARLTTVKDFHATEIEWGFISYLKTALSQVSIWVSFLQLAAKICNKYF